MTYTHTLLKKMHHHTASASDLFSLLMQYHMIPQLIGESVVDQAIAPIYCTPEETAEALQALYQQWGLNTENEQQEWRSHYDISQIELEQFATRSLRLEKFKQATWGNKLKSYFLQRKDDLDRVIYSLFRTKDTDSAQELYFRVQEGEISFTELVHAYSEGPEAQTGGLLGPVELGTLHPNLVKVLHTSPIGSIEPLGIGEWCLIVRLEKRIPAQFDETMQQRLLQELFEQWLQDQFQRLPAPDQRWLGIIPNPSIAA
jgi:parvulin-like peptidyl-prolyl isomerase